MTDRRRILACAFLRALAVGVVGVLAALHLARAGLSPAGIGVVIGVGLAGGALATLLSTLFADRFGRRRALLVLALVGATGGAGVALAREPAMLGIAAFIGMLNGMGRDRGASLVIEQAVLPGLIGERERTRGFAWYNVLQDAGHALGALLAATPAVLRSVFALDDALALRVAMGFAALLLLATGALVAGLSPAVEAPAAARRTPVSPESRKLLWRISSLFAIDSLGGGLLTTALLSYFFFERFGVDEGTLGPLFFGARVLNALSHLGAAWLAGRIGLVNTMVFTHIPSSMLLATVAIAPSFPIAALLFLLREGLVEMDVPTRQSYVMAVVKPEERTFASGVTHLVRLAAWSVGPAFAGAFMQGVSLATPLVAGAAMKIAYDLLLWRAFRGVKPPEERG